MDETLIVDDTHFPTSKGLKAGLTSSARMFGDLMVLTSQRIEPGPFRMVAQRFNH